MEGLLADYVAAEDALRAFTDRNFGRMCAICARWTLLAARANAAARLMPLGDDPAGTEDGMGDGVGLGGSPTVRQHSGGWAAAAAAGRQVTWRLQSWVTNCCNANHALESMDETSLAGIVASREEGRQWWRKVKRAQAAPCAALTDGGCYLQRGRPELCNRYFCEAVRDYLWMLGGEADGARLAAELDELQRRWAKLYGVYQTAVTRGTGGTRGARGAAAVAPRSTVRRDAGWEGFFAHLAWFDQAIAGCARPVAAQEMAHRLFKVDGDRSLYEPFFGQEIAAIGGHIRHPETAEPG